MLRGNSRHLVQGSFSLSCPVRYPSQRGFSYLDAASAPAAVARKPPARPTRVIDLTGTTAGGMAQESIRGSGGPKLPVVRCAGVRARKKKEDR